MNDKLKDQLNELTSYLPSLIEGIKRTHCNGTPENRLCSRRDRRSAHNRIHPSLGHEDCGFWDEEWGCMRCRVETLLDEIEIP